MLDNKLKTQNLSTQSYLGASFAQFTHPFGGVGAFVYADGTYTAPQKSSEASALRVGGAFEEITNFGNSRTLQFDAYPYVQTDFRGNALIGGGDFIFEYYDLPNNIGGRTTQNENHYVDTYLRVLPELNVFDVSSAGLTRFHDKTAYAFVGGTLGTRTVFFENNPAVSPYLCGHVYLNAAVQGYVNATSGKTIGDFNSELGYNLAPATFSAGCKAGSSSASNATIALEYFLGTDPATYLRQNQLKLALKLKF